MHARSTLPLSLAAALTGLTLVAPPSALAAFSDVKPRATTMAAGASHTVLIDGAGAVWGVGSSADGQLGALGTASALRKIPGLPVNVTAVAVDAGPDFTLVLGSDGVPYGTGANDDGQLTGTGGADVTALRPLTGLPSSTRAKAIAAGSGFTLVVGSDGVVYGTGLNDRSQLTGTDAVRTTLSPLSGLPSTVNAASVDAGDDFSVVLGTDGKAYGAGANSSRQLGLTSTSDVATLTSFDITSTVKAVAAGADATYLLADGKVTTAGLDAAPTTDSKTGFVGVAANPQGSSVLAVNDDGSVYGRGDNAGAQLTGTTASVSSFTVLTEPTGYNEFDKAVEVAAGKTHTLVRDARGMAFSTGTAAPGVSATSLVLLPGQKFATKARPTVVTGTTIVPGQVLEANEAEWIPSDVGASSFQWQRDGRPITGATAREYTVTDADKDSILTVVELRSGGGFGSGTSESESLDVGLSTLKPRKAASISGTARVGALLTMTDAEFEPQQEDRTRIWLRNGVQISGATHMTYRLTVADAGKQISARSIGLKPGSVNGVSTSAAVRVAIHNTALPTISGTAKVGKRLKVTSKGTWFGAASYTYQWYRGSAKISGATKTSYKLTNKDRKKKISLRVSAKRPGFATLTKASRSTAKVR